MGIVDNSLDNPGYLFQMPKESLRKNFNKDSKNDFYTNINLVISKQKIDGDELSGEQDTSDRAIEKESDEDLANFNFNFNNFHTVDDDLYTTESSIDLTILANLTKLN